jgi:uncharacterized protein (DUF433 family)
MSPGVCGGKPRIAGHRIKVSNIAVSHERMGLAPHQIVQNHPGLTLGDVYAALSYYWDHREEIDAEIEASHIQEQNQSSAKNRWRERFGFILMNTFRLALPQGYDSAALM